MEIIKENIWNIYKKYDAICCTTNNVIKNNGELVMGAGIAKEFAQKYSWLAKEWGRRISEKKLPKNCHIGLFCTLMKTRPHLIYFPTKWHWKNNSDISLIKTSIEDLCHLITIMGWKSVLLPKPGCSNGGLNWEKDVLPKIKFWLEEYPIYIIEK